jgi:hypothetical protein
LSCPRSATCKSNVQRRFRWRNSTSIFHLQSFSLLSLTADHGNRYLAPPALPCHSASPKFLGWHPGQCWCFRIQSLQLCQIPAKLLLSHTCPVSICLLPFDDFYLRSFLPSSSPLFSKIPFFLHISLCHWLALFLENTHHNRHAHMVHRRCLSRNRIRIRPTATRPRRSSHRSRARPVQGL